nr:phosphoenolpyruvate carboxykinase domain-containing protein [Candidatus Sigynarchaeota archaeon]
MCGKTSTAMLPGERIVGDDIAYLRVKNGKAFAVNFENGIFGIIDGVNAKDDPLIFKKLHDDNEEVIFSNVLLKDDMNVYWSGMDKGSVPTNGVNFSGEWTKGKKGPDSKEIPPSHKNARFTIKISTFENADNEMLDEKNGCLVSGYIYGGRDMDTSVPVEQAFEWDHGIVYYGAALESETTAATVGQAGVRVFNPMSNIDFLSVPIGKYIKMNLDFGYDLKQKPAIFHVNYFLQDEKGKWLNERTDKSVWLKWMELRVHGDVKAYKTPTGFVPVYDDLKKLFKDVLGKEYTNDQYIQQFSIRVDKHLEKIARIRKIYEKENAWIKANSKDASNYIPDVLFKVLDDQEARLKDVQSKSGALVSPEAFPKA